MKQKHHTLFLSYDGLCDPLGRSQILPYLTGLAKTGNFHIHVVSAEKPEVNTKQVAEICQLAGINWQPVKFSNKIKGFSAWQNLKNIKQKAFSIASEFPVRLIHARSLPMAVIAGQVAKKHHSKIIFDTRGFWLNERVEGKIWNMKNPVYFFQYKKMQKAEKELIGAASAVVVLTEAAKKHWLNENPLLPATKFHVIPCCVDLELFDSKLAVQKNGLKQKNGWADKKVITYVGSLGTWYLIDEMMRFFKMLWEKNPNVIFNIISKDKAGQSSLLEKKYGLPSGVVSITAAGRNEMPAKIASSDIGLFFIKPSFSKKGSSPTKLAEFLAMGVPVISNKGIGDMDEQFANNNIGFLVNDFTDESFKPAIEYILDSDKQKNNNCVQVAGSFYNLQNAVIAYSRIYSELTSHC